MAENRNLALQLLITAKDEASAAFGKIFGFLDKTTSATANLIREKFTDLFGGGLEGAIEFEAQLDRVQAKGGYTAEVMATLKKSAEDIGAAFGISGTEAAQGMESLAAAGLNAEQVIQTLPTVLSLAKAEALSFDAASALVANSLTTVGLGFDQAARLADVLTQAANESTTSASAVGKALETAGGIARASALDLEQTVAALTALAKGGIEGERAGTALAAILTQLLNPASSASKELTALGITSRDLGTVIGELESRGAGANTAILAFGETAGPGLRALIGQGQGALTELETAMRGAGGAAGNAAEQMGGNLKTALSGLESAWESVKTALLEPVLEPLAKAANDASTALNTNLREGALKPVQEAIKAFVENSIQFAREFIASFDFKGVAASLQDLARTSGEAFTAIGDYGGKAANTVQIAWNGVTATVRSIGAVMVEITASVVATLANIEEAASKVGLGSVERANALRQKAIEMQATAKELLANARQDASELGAAYDRLTTNADAAADAQQNLKDALPVAELQTLTKTLADYQGMAERAHVQSAQAAKDFEAGKISAQEYGEKLLAAAEANLELADATKAAAQATTFGKEALDGQLNTLLQTAKADADLAEAQEAVRQSALNLIQAEIDLAQAKGDTAEVTRLQNRLADTEIQQAREVAAEKEKEAASLRAQLANRLAYRASLDATNDALEQEIQLLIARTNAANDDATAAQKQVETLDGEIAAADRAAGPIGQLIRLYRDQADEHQRAADISERYTDVRLKELEGSIRVAEAKGDEAEAARLLAEQQEALIDQAEQIAANRAQEATDAENAVAAKTLELAADGELSKADQQQIADLQAVAKDKRAAAIESANHANALRKEADSAKTVATVLEDGAQRTQRMAKDADKAVKEGAANAKAASGLIASFYNSAITVLSSLSEGAVHHFKRMRGEIVPTGDELEVVQQRIEKTEQALARMGTGGGSRFIVWLGQITRDAVTAQKVFLDQAKAAERLAEQLESVGEGGHYTAGALEQLVRQAQVSTETMKLLDQQRLDRLQSAIDSATDKLREMQEATADARTRLAELNAELLESQGLDQKAQLLRQQIDYQQTLAEIEAQRQEAELMGNRELVTILNQQKSTLDQINRTKIANIQADTDNSAATDRATQRVSQLANETERAALAAERVAVAMNTLGSSSLATLNDQAGSLRQHLSEVNSLL